MSQFTLTTHTSPPLCCLYSAMVVVTSLSQHAERPMVGEGGQQALGGLDPKAVGAGYARSMGHGPRF